MYSVLAHPRCALLLPPSYTCIFSFCKIKRHSRCQPHAAAHHQQQRATHKTLSGRSENFKAKLRESFKRDTCAANSLHSARPASAVVTVLSLEAGAYILTARSQ